MSYKQRNATLDCLKFLCAIIVVFIHANAQTDNVCTDSFYYNCFLYAVWAVCPVEIFILITGVFLFRDAFDFDKSCFIDDIYLNRIKKYISLYLFWSVLYLPNLISRVVQLINEDNSLIVICLFLIKRFFVTGTTGILWYMVGIIYSFILLHYLLPRYNDCIVAFLAILLYVFSAISGSYYHLLINFPYLKSVYDILLKYTGHFYVLKVPIFMLIGYYLNKYNILSIIIKNDVKAKVIVLISYLCSVYLIFLERGYCLSNSVGKAYSAYFCCLLTPTLLVILAISFYITGNRLTAYLGNSSSIIYFTHWQFIMLYDYYSVNYNIWMCILYCTAVGLLLTYIKGRIKFTFL